MKDSSPSPSPARSGLESDSSPSPRTRCPHLWIPSPRHIKHFKMDLRKSQEGSEQKWGGGPDLPVPLRGDATVSASY